MVCNGLQKLKLSQNIELQNTIKIQSSGLGLEHSSRTNQSQFEHSRFRNLLTINPFLSFSQNLDYMQTLFMKTEKKLRIIKIILSFNHVQATVVPML